MTASRADVAAAFSYVIAVGKGLAFVVYTALAGITSSGVDMVLESLVNVGSDPAQVTAALEAVHLEPTQRVAVMALVGFGVRVIRDRQKRTKPVESGAPSATATATSVSVSTTEQPK